MGATGNETKFMSDCIEQCAEMADYGQCEAFCGRMWEKVGVCAAEMRQTAGMMLEQAREICIEASRFCWGMVKAALWNSSDMESAAPSPSEVPDKIPTSIAEITRETGGISSGAIAGIAVGAAVVAAAGIGAGVCVYRRKRGLARENSSSGKEMSSL